MNRLRRCLLIVLSLVAACSQDAFVPFEQSKVFNVLEDNIHSSRQNSRVTASFDQLSYDHSNGYSQSFELLRAYGVGHKYVTSGEIGLKSLTNVNVLFVNLMDDRHPKFSEAELEAVDEYVSGGGGLFVIVDHTNAYRHSEWTQPLLSPYGIDLPYQLACDYPPDTVKQIQWLNITRFKEHPVTADIRNLGYFAAGPLIGPGSLAWTSENGFRDNWNESDPPSYWANFRQDDDEPSMSSSVLNAVEYGEGRVVVVSDQNIFGNPFSAWADNRRLWLNAMQWVAGKDSLPPLRENKLPKPEVLADYRGNDPVLYHRSGYNGILYNISRQEDFFFTLALAAPASTPDVLFLWEPETLADPSDVASAQTVLADGGEVFVFIDPSNITEAAYTLIKELWPEFELKDHESNTLEAGPHQLTQMNAPTIGGLKVRSQPDIDTAYRVSVEGGEVIAWLEDSDSKSTLIAKNGHVYVVVQPEVAQLWEAVEGLTKLLAPLVETEPNSAL